MRWFIIVLVCVAASPTTNPVSGPKKLAILVHETGGALAHFSEIRQAVVNKVDSLDEGQSFNIVTFGNGKHTAFRPQSVTASDREKGAAESFMENLTPSGTGDVSGAVRTALGGKPEVMWFFVDGAVHAEYILAVKQGLAQWNGRLNAVVVTGYDTTDENVAALWRAAHAHGGKCFVVDADGGTAPRVLEKPDEWKPKKKKETPKRPKAPTVFKD